MNYLFFFLRQKCLFHLLTGYYCPGCGGTRAVKLLLTGHPLYSFIYHPLVLYGVFGLVVNTLLWLKNKNHHPSMKWLWVAILILVINFLVKNIALYYGYDLLAITQV